MAILGNTTPSTTYVGVSSSVYQTQLVLPQESGLITSLSIYCRDEAMSLEPPNDIFDATCNIFNNNKVYVMRFSGITITKYTGWAWRTMTPYMSSGYNMVANQPFYILLNGVGHDAYDQMRVGYITGYPNNKKVTTIFAIPPVLNEDGYYCINFTYTPSFTGPPVKIDNTTPGKLEHTSWSNIASLK
jgi:hypothetical protein